MPIHTHIENEIAEIIFEFPPVNAFNSKTWNDIPKVINDLGFPLGNRLMTFYLSKPGHVNFITPNQQPRTTLSPTMIFHLILITSLKLRIWL